MVASECPLAYSPIGHMLHFTPNSGPSETELYGLLLDSLANVPVNLGLQTLTAFALQDFNVS